MSVKRIVMSRRSSVGGAGCGLCFQRGELLSGRRNRGFKHIPQYGALCFQRDE